MAHDCWQLKAILMSDKPLYDASETESLYRILADRIRKAPANAKPGENGLYLDHDSAQQTVWGLRVLQDELRASGRPGFSPDDKAIALARSELERWTAFDVRGLKRERVAGARLGDRMKRVALFDLDAFLPSARKWLKEYGTK